MGTGSRQKTVMIIAGEASGDHHGAALVSAMRRLDGALGFSGIGGPAMRRAGVDTYVDAAMLSVVGITEVLTKLPQLRRALSRTQKKLDQLKPDLTILIDFPDFNLRVAAHAKKLGIPVLYYISPQIWAWRPRRVKTIGKRVDHVAVILPFEQPFFRKHRIPSTFVGHPLMDAEPIAPAFADSAAISGTMTVGLLPGSRDREVSRLLPVMLSSVGILRRRNKGLKCIVSKAPPVQDELVDSILGASQVPYAIEQVGGPVREVLDRCHLAIAASGTVTLEAAIRGVPMVIVYKVSPLSFHLAKALVNVPYVGLANLIAGREIVPELIQNDATPENIASKIQELIEDGPRLESIRRELLDVRERLGTPGAARRTAGIALEMMGAGALC